jgi:DNA-binding LacI/PurR family transcriptional regulator
VGNRVTLQTIADRLGVSRTTVSNAYNRPDQLAPELRERILAAARELGYAGPDAAARRLRSGGPEAVGLLLTESLSYAFVDPGAIGFLRGFALAIEEARLSMLVIPALRGGGDPAQSAVRDAVVDAFCLYSMPERSPDVQAAVERRLPIVAVDEPRDLAGHAFVGIEDRDGARLAGEHLVALGHRKLGLVSFRMTDDGYRGPLTPEREALATYPVTIDRMTGLRDAAVAAGVPLVGEEVEFNSPEEGAAGLRGLLARDPGVTAVFCDTDQLALGAIAAARGMGLEVPGDLSIVGFDDIPAAAEAELTTVRQPLLEKGLAAGRLVIAGEAAVVRRVKLPVELVVRRTTGPPRRT